MKTPTNITGFNCESFVGYYGKKVKGNDLLEKDIRKGDLILWREQDIDFAAEVSQYEPGDDIYVFTDKGEEVLAIESILHYIHIGWREKMKIVMDMHDYIKSCEFTVTDHVNDDGENYMIHYLGSLINPSGKYRVVMISDYRQEESVEKAIDFLYWKCLESACESLGAWVESGEGDPTDTFIAKPIWQRINDDLRSTLNQIGYHTIGQIVDGDMGEDQHAQIINILEKIQELA